MGGRDHFRFVRKALTYQVNDYLPYPVSPSSLLNSLHGLRSHLETDPAHKTSSFFKTPVQMNGKPMHSSHVIRIVKAYVRDHLSDEITLKKISDMLHFNCAYLGQKFKLEEKMSFNDYMLQQRMEKAQQLLSSTNLRIYEIAIEVGYKDIDWFYKKFKAYAGSSPNAYRRQKSTRPKGGLPNRFVYQLDNNHKKTQEEEYILRFFVVIWVWSNPEYSPLTYQRDSRYSWGVIPVIFLKVG